MNGMNSVLRFGGWRDVNGEVVPAFVVLAVVHSFSAVVHSVDAEAVEQIAVGFASVMQFLVVVENVVGQFLDILRSEVSQLVRIGVMIDAIGSQGEGKFCWISLHRHAVVRSLT